MCCTLLCSQTTDSTPILCERKPQCSIGDDAAVDFAGAVDESAALLRRRRGPGAQLHAHYSVHWKEDNSRLSGHFSNQFNAASGTALEFYAYSPYGNGTEPTWAALKRLLIGSEGEYSGHYHVHSSKRIELVKGSIQRQPFLYERRTTLKIRWFCNVCVNAICRFIYGFHYSSSSLSNLRIVTRAYRPLYIFILL